MSELQKQKILFTPAEVCERLSICRRTLTNLMSDGRLGHTRIGRAVRFRADEVDRFIDAVTVKPKGWKQPRPIAIRQHVG